MTKASIFLNKANFLLADIRHYLFILYTHKKIEDKQTTNKIQSMKRTQNIALLHAALRIFRYFSSVVLFVNHKDMTG